MNALNFNRYRPPVLPVEMRDDDRTVINVTLPTVELQEELRATAREMTALLTGGDEDQRVAIWDLAARLMSCNRNMRKITPEVLRKDFRLDEEDLVVFFRFYADFLNGTENAKN
jgi:hypothetical protein